MHCHARHPLSTYSHPGHIHAAAEAASEGAGKGEGDVGGEEEDDDEGLEAYERGPRRAAKVNRPCGSPLLSSAMHGTHVYEGAVQPTWGALNNVVHMVQNLHLFVQHGVVLHSRDVPSDA